MWRQGKSARRNRAPPPANTGGKPVDAATAGTVTGTIKLDGAAPKMKIINMAAEPNCAKQHTTPGDDRRRRPRRRRHAAERGRLPQGRLQRSIRSLRPPTPVTIDQKGCQYHPHVLALMTGQPLQVINSDMTTHNIHPVPKNNREWNESQPPGSAPIMQSFAREEVAIPVKCNVHPWMKAYIAVFGNPYFQVTGKDGSFTLKNVPPGTYTVTAWHEPYGTQDQMVTVGPKESKAVTLTFKAAASGNVIATAATGHRSHRRSAPTYDGRRTLACSRSVVVNP